MDDTRKLQGEETRRQLADSEFGRTGMLWSAAEDAQLLDLFLKEKLAPLQIAIELRRTLGSITSRLRLHGYLQTNNMGFVQQFATQISEGVNPITGEVLGEDSAWRHPKILEDLKRYSKGVKQDPVTNKGSQETSRKTVLGSGEHRLIAALIANVEQYQPHISERDALMLKEYYGKEGMPKTLEEVGKSFGVSRERVRQIREKHLKRISGAILRGEFTHPRVAKVKPLISGLNNSEVKQMALSYMEALLLSISSKENWSVKEDVTLESNSDWQDCDENEQHDLDLPVQQKHSEEESSDFFRIELFKSYRPFRKSKSENDAVALDVEGLMDKRRENREKNRLLNFGTTITWEEVYEIKHRYYRGDDLLKMEKFFQRSRKSIDYVLLETIEGYERAISDEDNTD